MNPDSIFIPSIKLTPEIKDMDMIRRAVNCYFDADYKGMKGFIIEYGEEYFFRDLVKYFKLGYWHNPVNQYYTFAGITVSFFGIYN
jgi:hypothetical protein